MARKIHPAVFKKAILLILVFSLGIYFGHQYFDKVKITLSNIQVEKNTPKAFISEVYDKILANYWEKTTDEKLIEVFKKASEVSGKPLGENIKTKSELIKNLDSGKVATIAAYVLASLQPNNRSGLFTQVQEQALNNTVANINPEKDLYKDVGVQKGASQAAVAEAYQKKEEELKKDNTPEAKQKLKEISYAKEVLTDESTKKRYDSGGVEPTIFTQTYGNTLYVEFKKFSPSSLDEFQKAFEGNKDKNLDSLILDLRGNIGGAIDSTAYFLGFFIGKNQSAFDFYQRGDFLPFRTPTDKLPSITKYKQMVILTDNQTQSSAEMMAASFKKYHLGIVLGTPTKGWGTVERVFPIDNQFDKNIKYSLFLVHSITLRDDNQPIEGRGVEPDIKITDSNWQSQLFQYFRNSDLINAVKTIL